MIKKGSENSWTGLEIAIIGMSGRFPGAADIDEFWNNLKDGVESISFFSDEELENAGVSPDFTRNPNFIKALGVMKGVEFFDSSFFGYTPKEAQVMDPQIRVFYEFAWHALEDAGYNPESYKGQIGLYAGAASNLHWKLLTLMSGMSDSTERFAANQLSDRDFLCTRVSYKFNLKGPSSMVQTACSTSLVAVHQACRALLSGECKMALAGGVSISLRDPGYFFQEGMIASPDGHCRAFDARSKGTIFGNGVGIVVLKRLKNALAHGDNIHGVIKGTAANNDGSRKVGFTAPSIEGQAEVIRMAQRIGRVEPESVTYIETHGTGTELGDPVEIEGLKQAFNTDKKGFCRIGSVKTNVGHLNIASGITGLIKAVMCLKHKVIPPSLHFETPNPKIDFKNSPFIVNSKLTEWSNQNGPLRAGVSSFGIGGSNAHVVLEEPPKSESSVPSKRPYHLVLISAKTKAPLDRMTENLVEYLKERPSLDLADTVFSLQVGRKAFESRKMLIAENLDDIYGNHAQWESSTAKIEKRAVFMFPGQGAQYVNMGRELYEKESLFRQEVDRCFQVLKPFVSVDLENILYPGDQSLHQGQVPVQDNVQKASPHINQTEITQPLIFIIEYALAKLLMHWGIGPHAMIGHSIGEYTAACLAGVFSLPDALKLVALRGKLMQQMPGGGMLSVPLSEKELVPILDTGVEIAAVNAPELCVVSGTHEDIDRFSEKLLKSDIQCRKLHTSHAFHSKMMAPILEQFTREVAGISLEKPKLPFISNLSGNWITVDEATSPRYWARHLREGVRFCDGVTELLKEENAIFIEVGPGRSLSTFTRQNLDIKEGQIALNLIKHPKEDVPDNYFLLDKIGRLWLSGLVVDWEGLYSGEKRKRIPLPKYSFERHRYWFDRKQTTKGDRLPSGSPVQFHVELESPQESDSQYVAPESEYEKIIAQIWQALLGIDKISLHDDFFEIGGDSLKAITVAGRIHKETSHEIPITEFFRHSSLKELASYLEEKSGESSFISIEPVESKDYYPLSSAQRRMYILQKLEPAGTGYNLPLVFKLDGHLDMGVLKEIVQTLITRHESLRTYFVMPGVEPVQRIRPAETIDLQIEFIALNSNKDNEESEEGMVTTGQIIKKFVRPFDLSRAPLMRVGVIEVEKDQHVLMVDIHHIVHDGTSQAIFFKEFQSLAAGKKLPRLKIQYKDFSEWQNQMLAGAYIKKREEFWLSQFSEEVPVLNLPTDFPRPRVQSFSGDSFHFELGDEETVWLRDYSSRQGVTLYMILLSLVNILLSKLSGQEDIVVGTPVVGRRHADLEQVIGLFINTLALVNFPKGDRDFHNFLEEVKERAITAFENQDYQYEDLVEKLNVNRDAGRNPLFDVMFQFQNIGSRKISTGKDESKKEGGLRVKSSPFQSKTAKFDMEITAREARDRLSFKIDFCDRLFKKETVGRFVDYFKKIVSSVISDPKIRLKEIHIISEEEKKQVLVDFNDTEASFPQDETIHSLFEKQVEKTPELVAITGSHHPSGQDTHQTGTPVSMTYREVSEKSGQLAMILRNKGVQENTLVAILVERSLEMICGIFAILKAGGAYLPLSPTYPENRQKYILQDSDAGYLLTCHGIKDQADRLEGLGMETVFIEDTDSSQLTDRPVHSPHQPAYVIYTSGSTGLPKGALIEHRSVINRLNWMQRRYPIGPGDVILQKTTYVFDVSVWELFWWSFQGASLTLLGIEQEKNPEAIFESVATNRVTTIHFVPSMLKLFLEYCEQARDLTRLSSLKQVFASGEALGAHQVVKFNQLVHLPSGAGLYNLYGPTEATVDVSYYDCPSQGEVTTVPIGKPIDNIRLLIMDKAQNIQPPGINGELCIAGVGLARGYLNRPELTSEKFVDGELYRTGDLARWLPDGNIEFLGRIDHQVKVRGFRIELEEIENRLRDHDCIRETLVLAKDAGREEQYLCAYFVVEKPGEKGAEVQVPNTSELRNFLAIDLPEYMIPSHFIALEDIPVTPNGKIDRKKLPEPQGDRPDLAVTYTAPDTEMEKIIGQIWQEVLKLDKIGVNDNFFELGGNSLDVVRISARLKEILSRDIPVVSIFRFPTLLTFASYLTSENAELNIQKDRTSTLQKGELMKKKRLQARRGNRK